MALLSSRQMYQVGLNLEPGISVLVKAILKGAHPRVSVLGELMVLAARGNLRHSEDGKRYHTRSQTFPPSPTVLVVTVWRPSGAVVDQGAVAGRAYTLSLSTVDLLLAASHYCSVPARPIVLVVAAQRLYLESHRISSSVFVAAWMLPWCPSSPVFSS